MKLLSRVILALAAVALVAGFVLGAVPVKVYRADGPATAKDAFYEQVRGQGGTTENEMKLRAEIGELRIKVKSLSEERSALYSAVDRFARIVQALTLENEVLRSSAQRTDAVVRRLPGPGPEGDERR